MTAFLDEEIERRFRRWLVERNRRGLRMGLIIMITLYPAFGLLDWALAPAHALPWLWTTRALVAAATLALFRFSRSSAFERWGEVVSAGYVWVGSAGVSVMTIYMGGLASPYYAGVSLMLLAAGLLLLWRWPIIVATYTAVVATFVAVNLASGTVGSVSTGISNLAFLCTTALVAGVGQILTLGIQREQHEQRVRLEHATASLSLAHADLQRLDEFKSRFFANVTHELRTPLAMILTPLELLLQGEMGQLTAAQRASFESMFKSSLKLLKLIDDLLDLSRLEESRLRLDVREHDLVPHLRSLTEETEVLAKRREIALAFAPAVDRALVECDLDRMERVFVNLLSNAIKFARPGGHVEVALAETPETIEVAVRDDGPGFPAEMAPRLFERFFQVDMKGTRLHGGAGIGLALAKELVLLHGGTIDARSDGRSGSEFRVRLPKRSAGEAGEAPRVEVPSPPEERQLGVDWSLQLERRKEFRLLAIEEATDRRSLERDPDEEARPYTALVVEDNPQVLQIVHMTLRREFKMLAAADGLRGLELAIREQPSLVIADLMMPGLDGLELTRRLRADPRTRHVPVLMLTARGALDDRVKGLETGVSAYLTKPFSPRELVTCARELVRAKERTADLVLTRRMESVEMVTAGLAHEINNPLNYATNALGRLRLDADQALALALAARRRTLEVGEEAQLERAATRVREMIDVAEAGLKRIAGTVELMSRYGRAGFRRELVPHDAWAAVRTVVAVVVPATGRAVEVELDLRGDGTLECVPEELHQVLTNLVQNAVEAAPDEGGLVRVTGVDEEDSLLLSVKDNGPGIPAEIRAQLFTPFFTTKGPGRGMGLGLTIAMRVVQSLGGTLRVVSAPGAGTEFVMRVPRTQEQHELAVAASS
jgi:signal transduction histidine kinase